MKYVWTAIAGVLVGALVGAALLLINPLTAPGEARLEGFDRVLHYALPSDVLLVTHGGRWPIERQPLDAEPLWEETIRSSALATIVLRDASGEPRAVASRLTSPSTRTDLLTAGLLVIDHWLVSLPDEGTFFVIAESNVSTVARDTLVSVQLLGREWAGARAYAPTAGPGIAGMASLIGAAGAFGERSGRALERYRIDAFTRVGGVVRAAGELHVAVDGAPASAEEAGAPHSGAAESLARGAGGDR